jgi:D-alanyl-D-alanine carboxypeptidase
MNFKRVIIGPLLSVVFLTGFIYAVSGINVVFGKMSLNFNPQNYLSSISGGIQNNQQINYPQNLVASQVPQIDAESAISVESDLSRTSKILFEKSSNNKLPIASLTKLMTAVVVIDRYNLSDTAVVDKIADSQSPLKQDIKLGDIMTVDNLLKIMLVKSSNKAAYTLAERSNGETGVKNFVALMNQKAKEMGLDSTFYVDPTGLNPDNISTASDLIKLTEYILKNYPEIAEISRQRKINVPGFGTIENSDPLLGGIPDVVCSKTGFTAEAKGCLLLVIDKPGSDNYLINVVLGADNRFFEMQKLISWSNAACK